MAKSSFELINDLIKDDDVFTTTRRPQPNTRHQLLATLYRLGTYGNRAITGTVARKFGISEGSVVNYAARSSTCYTSSPHALAV